MSGTSVCFLISCYHYSCDVFGHIFPGDAMPRGRPRTFEITLTETGRTALADIAGSRSLPAGVVRRARVILLSADGETNRDIAAAVDLSGTMVGHWRRRFRDAGLVGLYDAPRAGRA